MRRLGNGDDQGIRAAHRTAATSRATSGSGSKRIYHVPGLRSYARRLSTSLRATAGSVVRRRQEPQDGAHRGNRLVSLTCSGVNAIVGPIA
jgi:hypothetical protein